MEGGRGGWEAEERTFSGCRRRCGCPSRVCRVSGLAAARPRWRPCPFLIHATAPEQQSPLIRLARGRRLLDRTPVTPVVTSVHTRSWRDGWPRPLRGSPGAPLPDSLRVLQLVVFSQTTPLPDVQQQTHFPVHPGTRNSRYPRPSSATQSSPSPPSLTRLFYPNAAHLDGHRVVVHVGEGAKAAVGVHRHGRPRPAVEPRRGHFLDR